MQRAYHECWHAIGSRQLGLRVTSLSLGAATSMVPLMEDSETMTDSGRKRFATVAFCGPFAETRYVKLAGDECRTLWLDGGPWSGDRANIERCQLTDAERAKARATADQLVITHWRKIEALVPVLIERGSLAEDEIRELLRRCISIDGDLAGFEFYYRYSKSRNSAQEPH